MTLCEELNLCNQLIGQTDHISTGRPHGVSENLKTDALSNTVLCVADNKTSSGQYM